MQRGPTGHSNVSATLWCSIIRASVGRTKGRGGHSALSANSDSKLARSVCWYAVCVLGPLCRLSSTNFRRGDALNTERKTEMEPDEHPRVARRAVTGPGARPGRESSSQMKWINANSGTLSPERLELAQPAPGRRNEV
ncbi:hypothetical protein NEUTE1DRAFT_113864 [Neurospora tetrasperma FGSC 2508]|uniref:Uncharacterized protein n=1 Tax=Neurospora tetrasperma (strain FGSC 2508 / ATCC MYA-4615 / P0657) TaxID=510951 RepID=F8N489_NEUT8|nr:uncharacterized protein NEUTE1DRAFT_113864 [Neurospora tetrasperma FGSC 2508]EGO51832.1 hypothetical protein NEUTE1DRAFT_113864 [Neurospora tetrasperma FGSC 2508]